MDESILSILDSPFGRTPEDWSLAQLKDVTTKIGSGATPRGGQQVYLSQRENFALVRSQNVFDRYFNDEGLAFISDEHAAELESVWLQPDDVLLNITGDGITFARACLVPERILPACVNQHVSIIRADQQICDPGYIVSYLTHPSIKHYIESFNAGGSRRAVTKGHIESFVIPLPPLPEQRAIAHILGSLDDKIELNRRMNATLEAMARAIFKSWFVDFEPVHAKVCGEQPSSMDAATAALFPDSFEESELGMIPNGWRVRKLGDVLDVLETGGRPKGGVQGITEGIPSIGAESIVGLGIFDFSKTKYIPFDFFISMNRGHVSDRDVLLYKDGGRPGIFEPHVAMFGDGFPFPEFSINEHVYRLRADTVLSQEYLYFWMSSDLAMQEMRDRGTGVAIPGLNSTAVRELSVIVPDQNALRLFARSAFALISKIFANCNESHTLAALRDTLLPRLISGELRVGEAEHAGRMAE